MFLADRFHVSLRPEAHVKHVVVCLLEHFPRLSCQLCFGVERQNFEWWPRWACHMHAQSPAHTHAHTSTHASKQAFARCPNLNSPFDVWTMRKTDHCPVVQGAASGGTVGTFTVSGAPSLDVGVSSTVFGKNRTRRGLLLKTICICIVCMKTVESVVHVSERVCAPDPQTNNSHPEI